MPPPILTPEAEAAVVDAISAAEAGNHAEIRVHLDRKAPGEPMESARRRFFELGMHRTREATGVLLYVALADHRVAVYAGGGVYRHVEPDVWQPVVDAVTAGFGRGDPGGGLCAGLALIGDIARRAVPGEDAAGDELPNTVSFT